MGKEFNVTEFENDGFLHSRTKGVNVNFNKKSFVIDMHAADLKNGGYITTCTMTITDWWDLEVIEYHGDKVINKFKGNDIPELDSIVGFTYDDNVLILEDLCGIDELYHFKFTKPNIQITGEYDPD